MHVAVVRTGTRAGVPMSLLATKRMRRGVPTHMSIENTFESSQGLHP